MRVLCRHGHFAFYPRESAEIADFMGYYELTLVQERDYWTFPFLLNAKDYCLKAKNYLNLPATVTFEGKPWEIFKQNNWVYDITKAQLVLKSAIVGKIDLPAVGEYYIPNPPIPLIQPGFRISNATQILSYDAEFIQDVFELRVRNFSNV